MGALPPRVPPSVIREMKLRRYHGLNSSDKYLIHSIIGIMYDMSGEQIRDWILLDVDTFKGKDENLDWCCKQIDRVLNKKYGK